MLGEVNANLSECFDVQEALMVSKIATVQASTEAKTQKQIDLLESRLTGKFQDTFDIISDKLEITNKKIENFQESITGQFEANKKENEDIKQQNISIRNWCIKGLVAIVVACIIIVICMCAELSLLETVQYILGLLFT